MSPFDLKQLRRKRHEAMVRHREENAPYDSWEMVLELKYQILREHCEADALAEIEREHAENVWSLEVEGDYVH